MMRLDTEFMQVISCYASNSNDSTLMLKEASKFGKMTRLVSNSTVSSASVRQTLVWSMGMKGEGVPKYYMAL